MNKLSEAGRNLQEAFMNAYASYVHSRTGNFGLSEEGAANLDKAVIQGRVWLANALEELLGLPFAEQRRGPLEVFQEAMRFPTEVLSNAKLPAAARDETTINALPGDIYDLAPASSHDLGEEAHYAHLIWGAAKAQALRPPLGVVGILCRNLLDRSKLEGLLQKQGWETVIIGGKTLPDNLDVALVDLEHPAAMQVIEASPVSAAFGPHVETELLEAARRWGANPVLPRSQAFRDPAGLVLKATQAIQSD